MLCILIIGANFKRHASLTVPLLRRAKLLSHADTINDCTDKLLGRWQTINDSTYIHLDMFHQLQQLVLDLFGFIFFGYDLQLLDNKSINEKNELAEALHTVLATAMLVIQMPRAISYISSIENINDHIGSQINTILE